MWLFLFAGSADFFIIRLMDELSILFVFICSIKHLQRVNTKVGTMWHLFWYAARKMGSSLWFILVYDTLIISFTRWAMHHYGPHGFSPVDSLIWTLDNDSVTKSSQQAHESKWCGIDVDAIILRRVDVSTTSFFFNISVFLDINRDSLIFHCGVS